MATTAWKNRYKRRAATVAKYAELRRKLKAAKDFVGLAKLPRDSSATRLTRRCEITGRRRGYYRKFGVSRLVLRQLASDGKIPGLRKSSW